MATMSNWKIHVNLAIVSIAFFCNMLSYMTMEGLQSSLNAEAGTQSVSAKYIAYVLASFFLPTLAMEFFSSRTVIILGTVPYLLFTLANFYPKTYVMLPVGVLLGCGSSVIWTAKRVYISDLAGAYAKSKGTDEGGVTSHFYGIFWATFSLSLIVGNVLSSAVIHNFGMEPRDFNATTPNITQANSTQANSTFTNITGPIAEKQFTVLRCGLHDCDENLGNLTSVSTQTDSDTQIKAEVLHALFGAFAAMQLGSILLLSCFADDAPSRDEKTQKDRKSAKEIATVCGDQMPAPIDEENPKKNTITKRVTQQMLATIKLLTYNHSAKAMILITIHIGALQSWALAQFTKYWVTCVIGIQYIGYVSAMLGLGSVVGGYGSGFLARYTGRSAIAAVAWFIEISVMIFLFIWDPEIQNQVWIFFAIFAAIGVLHTTYKTIIATATTMIFSEDKEAACATLCIWDPLGSAIVYMFSSTICNSSFIVMLVTLVSAGTVLYLIAELVHKRKSDAASTERPVV